MCCMFVCLPLWTSPGILKKQSPHRVPSQRSYFGEAGKMDPFYSLGTVSVPNSCFVCFQWCWKSVSIVWEAEMSPNFEAYKFVLNRGGESWVICTSGHWIVVRDNWVLYVTQMYKHTCAFVGSKWEFSPVFPNPFFLCFTWMWPLKEEFVYFTCVFKYGKT